MQFKYPEILFALILLIIPIIVHLFQLRKFKNEPFTNVQFLKELTIQTRKSSQLKKWLTLLTRLFLLACVIVAFSQPYTSESGNFKTKNEIVIYLDNSFSMQANGQNGTLLNTAVQDLIASLDDNDELSLFTNDANFPNTSVKAIKNDLIQLDYAPKQLSYNAAVLKGKQLFSKDDSSIKNLILISDFQQKEESLSLLNDSIVTTKLVKLKSTIDTNVSLDSIYVSNATVENIELTVSISNQGNPIETLPVSLFNDDKLIAKTATTIETEATTKFTIPSNTVFNGKVVIEDPSLQYDNTLFFNIDQRAKTKVLSVNGSDDTYLNKLYTSDEFDYQSTDLSNLNFNIIEQQNLIVLNEIDDIQNALITALKSFVDNGGTVLIIPSATIRLNTYNQLFANFGVSEIQPINPTEKRVTGINFSHPLLTNVFDQRVSNFQYPKVNSYYPNATSSVNSVLRYEDGSAFLSYANRTYAFSAPINTTNSNFQNSPLIVPVLYNIGKQSLKSGELYYVVGQENVIDIATQLQQDDILTLINGDSSVIPLQQTFDNKVELITSDYPETAGIIAVQNKQEFLKNLSFNYDRDESILRYMDLNNLTDVSVDNSVASTFNALKSASNVNELWKWFVIFAVIFLMIEMLILKYLK
ncbi:BatA domain-containing protein [Psychroserpens sp.]|uniref:BatA domain-containing protein n=1 Tax=Psychroserpens sp. TaxID=2020870 RepID=UPI001B0B06A2|nr:BatA domain-containing protein [Psychroserpens sp.]MBO6606556.1 VWA domain-containing protein [Psychroserpens sp.]MBO6631300.1 VWA domain-containing protein [Psychroserpens sp.]MBO6653260.1 VWA domain-containing protein [Psychroserpens sp.]MBO6680713.1 VWA domain-containing protein [Psychroserpens sp.]MBO6750329.1 VWA domain-containing protein [Psychroserpens sp.]